MGIFETVIRYRSEEAVEAAKAEGIEQAVYLRDVEHKINSIIKHLRLGLSMEVSAKLTELNESIVKEFSILTDAEKGKKFQKEIKKIRAKFSSKYFIDDLKKDLILLLLSMKLSEKSIGKVLKCPLGLIKKIKKNTTK